jgi:hypothetical protein
VWLRAVLTGNVMSGKSPISTSRLPDDRPLSFRAIWPFLVPLVCVVLVFIVQPADRLGALDGWGGVEGLLYDDYDGACMVLRGLNSIRGRRPSQAEHPPWLNPAEFDQALDSQVALKAGYYLEYPHATLLLFRLGYLFTPDIATQPIPAAVLDNSHHCLVEHRPRTDEEATLWREFRIALRTYVVLLTGCLLLLMALVARGYEPGGKLSGPAWLFVLPAALYFALMRFDVLPALLVAASLFCLGRRWLLVSAILLGVGTMVKVYPLFLAPVIVRYLTDQRRAAVSWTVAYLATLVSILLATVALFEWPLTVLPYRIQLARGLESNALYGFILPVELGAATWLGRSFRLGSVMLAILAMSWHNPVDLADVLRRAATVLLVFLAVQVFYSPQWLLWLLPLLAPLAWQNLTLLYWVIILDLITYLSFPIGADFGTQWGRVVLVVLRLAVWIGIGAALWRTGRQSTPRSVVGEPLSK